MTASIIDGKAIAADLRQTVARVAAKFRESAGRVPGLAVVLVGEHPPSAAYVRSKVKATLEAGMAIIQSGKERREIMLTRQRAVPADYDADLKIPYPLKT